MEEFKGFSGKAGNIQVPPEFFSTVLPALKDIDEIRFILILFWYLQSRDENTGYADVEELLAEPAVRKLFNHGEGQWESNFRSALDKALDDKLVLLGK